MEDMEKKTLCRQLRDVDTSLAFLVLLILSVCLSWKATAIQRADLCDYIKSEGSLTQGTDVFPIRLVASAIVSGAMFFFFGLALDRWEETRTQQGIVRCSAQWNLWASLFVLLAGLIRLYDLLYVQCNTANQSDNIEQEEQDEELPL